MLAEAACTEKEASSRAERLRLHVHGQSEVSAGRLDPTQGDIAMVASYVAYQAMRSGV